MESEFEMSVRQFLARPPFSLRGLTADELSVFCTALTHDSYSNEARNAGREVASYERLEFLGDAIIEFLVCEAAFSDASLATERDLTDYKISKVNNDSLGEVLSERVSGLEDAIRVGNGHIAEGGGKVLSPDMRADIFEALVAAVYLTRGMDAVRELVRRLLLRPSGHPWAHGTC